MIFHKKEGENSLITWLKRIKNNSTDAMNIFKQFYVNAIPIALTLFIILDNVMAQQQQKQSPQAQNVSTDQPTSHHSIFSISHVTLLRMPKNKFLSSSFSHFVFLFFWLFIKFRVLDAIFVNHVIRCYERNNFQV